MTPEERSRFLAEHRLCLVGYAPRARPRSYYAMDGGDIITSTTASRAKAKVRSARYAVRAGAGRRTRRPRVTPESFVP